jgi:glutamine synthetase
VATIRAVNVHADLMRAGIADAGNDHRLGANEAPPAIVSVFLGAQLEDIVEQLEKGPASSSKKGGSLQLGVTSLPVLPKDATDSNRTSPFAFTGNKFEFRAVGSSAPIYWPQTVLNTAVAESLEKLADELDKLKPNDFAGLTKILSGIIKENKQVLFSGNGYSEEWHAEAAKRGSAQQQEHRGRPSGAGDGQGQEAVREVRRAQRTRTGEPRRDHLGALRQGPEHRGQRHHRARQDHDPAGRRSSTWTSSRAPSKSKGAGKFADKIAALADKLVDGIDALEKAQHHAHEAGDLHAEAKSFKDKVIPAQEAVRDAADELETLVSDDMWPLPKYRELLFQY